MTQIVDEAIKQEEAERMVDEMFARSAEKTVSSARSFKNLEALERRLGEIEGMLRASLDSEARSLRDSVARLTAERDLAKAEAERATAQLVAVKDQAEKQRKALEDGFAARESLRKRAEEAAEQWAAARDELDAVRAMLAEETRRASQLAERVGELESRPPAQMSEEAVTEALIRKLLALDGIDTARIIAKLLGGK